MAEAPGTGPSRLRRAVVVFAVLVALLAIVGVLAALRLRSAERDLRSAQDMLETAGELIEGGRLQEAQTALTTATSHLTDALGSLHNHPELQILGALPVLGDNLDELQRSVGLATQLANGGSRILAAAGPLQGEGGRLEVPLSDGAIPLEAVQAVQREARQLAGVLPVRTSDGGGRLFGPVAELRDRVEAEAVERQEQLDELARALDLVADMSGANGERHYLIAVANSAEMRGTGGMVLSYGALVGRAGEFELRDFGRIDELSFAGNIERDAVPTVPDDYLRRWSGFDPLGRWRNANLAGDFEVVAPVLEMMYFAATGTVPSGVIQVDPEGLAAILAGTGPVEVSQLGTVTSDNVVDLVLDEAYQRFPGIEQRSDVLGEVAEAVFTRLVEGQYASLRPLADALLRAVDGRHLMMNSVTGDAQAHLRHFGAAGALPDPASEYLHLTVQNVSANKLDYYLDTALSVQGERPAGQPGALRAEVVITNTAPPGATEPRYVFGPFNEDQQAGLYRGIVTLYVPAGTMLGGVEGDVVRNPPVVQTEAGRALVSWSVDVPAGQSRRLVLDLELPPRPPGPYELVVVPSARVRPTQLHVDVGTGGARAALDAPLDRHLTVRVAEQG